MASNKELSEDLRQRFMRAHGKGKGYKAIPKQYEQIQKSQEVQHC